MNRIRTSLLIRMTFMVALTLILSMTAIGLFGYILNRNDAIRLSGERALAISITIADEIDAEQFKQIMQTEEKNDYWYNLKEHIDKIYKDNELLYLYVLDRDYDTEVTYFLEGYDAGARKDEEEIDLGDKESIQYHDQEMFDTINSGEAHVTDLYDSDGFGSMVSGYAPILDNNGKAVGVVGVDISLDEVLASSNAFGIYVIIFIVIANICLGFYITWYMKLKVGKPIAELTSASQKISKGDIDITMNTTRKDEIGSLVESFNEMIKSTKAQIQVIETLSNGDLTVDVTPRSKNDAMNIAIGKMIGSLSKMFAEINSSTMQVATAAKQIANGSQSLAQGSTEQASAVEQLSCSIAEIAQKTKDNATLALSASELGNTIKSNAEKGSTQMEHMVQAVKDIGESSRSIGKIIKLIDDIAFQTNILALNAAVEAARAGQHGKGFAIVAEEVRSLASKSAEAAKNTDSLITDSIEKTELGVSIATETAGSLSEIVSGINENSRIIEKIAESSKEQTTAIDQVNKGIEQVAQVVAQNSGTAEESAAASEEMSGQAAVLEELVAQFKIR